MWIIGEDEPIPVLHAYITGPLSNEAVAKLRADFASSAKNKLRLAIHNRADLYGKTAEEIRGLLEGESSETGDFLVVDPNVIENGTVWYVAEWVMDEEFGSEVIRSRADQPVVWRLLAPIKAVPSLWIQYSTGNGSIQEDLDACIDAWPWDPSAPQRVFGQNEPEQSRSAESTDSFTPPAYIVAESGEWEEGPGNLIEVDPPQERVYRLKAEVAERHGLRSSWAIGWEPGSYLNAPQGSMVFAQEYL